MIEHSNWFLKDSVDIQVVKEDTEISRQHRKNNSR